MTDLLDEVCADITIDELDQQPTHLAMRDYVLRQLAACVERWHAHQTRVLGADAVPDRLAAIVAILNEARAYWELNTTHHKPASRMLTADDYREIATDMWDKRRSIPTTMREIREGAHWTQVP